MPKKRSLNNFKSFVDLVSDFFRKDESLGLVVGMFSYFLAYSAIKYPIYTDRGKLYNLTGAEYIIAGILIVIGTFLIIDSFRK